MISGMVKVDIDTQDHLPALFKNYVAEDPSLRTFYTEPPSISGILNKARSIQFDTSSRETLVKVLLKQNDSISLHPAALAGIHSLKESGTYTVCTGHQVCLLGGPMYFALKILSVIRLAEELNLQNAGMKFVPLFWMHTEDHDAEEIASVSLFGKKIRWETKQEGATGRFSLSDIASFISEVLSVFGTSPGATELEALIKRAYDEKNNLATATRIFVNELFGKYGLVILDPDDKKLKEQFIPVVKEELMKHSGFKIVSQTNERLKKLGYEPQVRPREINLFDLNGKRERVTDGNKYISQADTHPEIFSPNVVLRSIYQQRILPNVAYVGGPAEISYWLQYKELHEHFHVAFPVLVPRNSVVLLDANTAAQLTEMGLSPAEMLLSEEELKRKYLSNSGKATEITEELGLLEDLIGKLAGRAKSVDPALESHVRSEGKKMKKLLDGIREKIHRSVVKKEEINLARISKIKGKLFPGNVSHERVGSFLQYYLSDGDSFFDNLKDRFEPCPKHILILTTSN